MDGIMKVRAIVMLMFVLLGAVASSAWGVPAGETTTEALDARIRQLRMGDVVVTTSPGVEVTITQIRHEFEFGTAVSNTVVPFSPQRPMKSLDRARYLKILETNFNAAVHENALKWPFCERTSNDGFDYALAESIYALCTERNITMRGHCIFWAKDRFVQRWVQELDDSALRGAVELRARDITRRFRSRIHEFDLNNEMVDGDFYRRHLGAGIVKDMAHWAKGGNPDARLYANDYAVLSGKGRNAEAYLQQIRSWLDQGVPLGGIGCQAHFGGPLDPNHVQGMLDRLARFKLPVKITEYDCDNEDEGLKERHLREFYRLCFAHPAIEGIYMWGFWEGAHWKPKAALWQRNWKMNPAAEAYRDLVFNQWWTCAQGNADPQGNYRTRAFYGRYRVESGGERRDVILTKDQGSIQIQF